MEKTEFVDAIIGALLAQIAKYDLELLKRYPDDLLVHDRSMLETYATAGAKIGWVLGDSHSHNVVLGVHPDDNIGVTYLTRLASNDRFYLLTIASSGGAFSLKEMTAAEFVDLNHTKIEYRREGKANCFWLTRQATRVGMVELENIGNPVNPKYRITITPVAGVTDRDRAALQRWAQKASIECAHTLFVRTEVIEAEPVQLQNAA